MATYRWVYDEVNWGLTAKKANQLLAQHPYEYKTTLFIIFIIKTAYNRSELLAGGHAGQHLSLQKLVSLHLLQRLWRSWEVRHGISSRQCMRNGVRHQRHGKHLRSGRARCRYCCSTAWLLPGAHLDGAGRVGCRRQHPSTTYQAPCRYYTYRLDFNYTLAVRQPMTAFCLTNRNNIEALLSKVHRCGTVCPQHWDHGTSVNRHSEDNF